MEGGWKLTGRPKHLPTFDRFDAAATVDFSDVYEYIPPALDTQASGWQRWLCDRQKAWWCDDRRRPDTRACLSEKDTAGARTSEATAVSAVLSITSGWPRPVDPAPVQSYADAQHDQVWARSQVSHRTPRSSSSTLASSSRSSTGTEQGQRVTVLYSCWSSYATRPGTGVPRSPTRTHYA